MDKKTLIIRISTVIIIVLAIAGIYVTKTSGLLCSFSGNGCATTTAESTSASGETVTAASEQASDESNAAGLPFATEKIELEKLKAHKLPLLIDFGSENCYSCKLLKPTLQTLYNELKGKAIIQYIDVWKYEYDSSLFPVSVIPTQAFFNSDGTPYVPSDEILKTVNFTLYTDKETDEHVLTMHVGILSEDQLRAIFAEMGVE